VCGTARGDFTFIFTHAQADGTVFVGYYGQSLEWAQGDCDGSTFTYAKGGIDMDHEGYGYDSGYWSGLATVT